MIAMSAEQGFSPLQKMKLNFTFPETLLSQVCLATLKTECDRNIVVSMNNLTYSVILRFLTKHIYSVIVVCLKTRTHFKELFLKHM